MRACAQRRAGGGARSAWRGREGRRDLQGRDVTTPARTGRHLSWLVTGAGRRPVLPSSPPPGAGRCRTASRVDVCPWAPRASQPSRNRAPPRRASPTPPPLREAAAAEGSAALTQDGGGRRKRKGAWRAARVAGSSMARSGRLRSGAAAKLKRWRKGHSSDCNPETRQHRLAARSRFCSRPAGERRERAGGQRPPL